METTEARPVDPPVIESWAQTPWRKLEAHVYRSQKRIYQAQRAGKHHVVHSLQRLLMKSEAARTLAVRRVTQDNHGKKTAGIDGIKSVGPAGLSSDRYPHLRRLGGGEKTWYMRVRSTRRCSPRQSTSGPGGPSRRRPM
jgi:hypothetical protein